LREDCEIFISVTLTGKHKINILTVSEVYEYNVYVQNLIDKMKGGHANLL